MPKLSNIYIRHSAYYLNVLRRADELFQQGGTAIEEGLTLFDKSLDNIRLGQARAKEHAVLQAQAAELCCDYPLMGANLLNMRLNPREHILWIEEALAAARRQDK